MLTKPVESILEAEDRAAQNIDKARSDSQGSLESCREHCASLIREREEQANELSRELNRSNREQIDEIFKRADIIAADKLSAVRSAAGNRQAEAIDCAIGIIAKG